MKKIKGVVSGVFEIPTTPVNLTMLMKEQQVARENAKKVWVSTAVLERKVEEIILHYFFPEKNEQKEFFKGHILQASWCTFDAKKKLISEILNRSKLLSGKKKNNCCKLLSDLIKYRNAVVHGKIETKSGKVHLCYFSGQPQRKELTDDFWTNVESAIFECFDILNEFAVAVGAKKSRMPIQN